MRTFGIFAALAAVRSVFATPMPVAESSTMADSSTVAGARQASVVARQDAGMLATIIAEFNKAIENFTAMIAESNPAVGNITGPEFTPAVEITARGIAESLQASTTVDQIHDKVSGAVNLINALINNSTHTPQDKVDQATNVLTNLTSGVVQLVGPLITGTVDPTANGTVNNSTDSVGSDEGDTLTLATVNILNGIVSILGAISSSLSDSVSSFGDILNPALTAAGVSLPN